MDDLIPTERYRLVLIHDYIDKTGKAHKIEEPLVVDCIAADVFNRGYFPSIVINDMFEKLRAKMMKAVNNKWG